MKKDTPIDMNYFRDWLRRSLKTSGMTQSDLARHWGRGPNYVSKILSGDRRMQIDEYAMMAKLFGESPLNLPIPIVGKVGAGGHVYGMDAGCLGMVDNDGSYPIGTQGVEVDGDSMGALVPHGSIVFYNDVYDAPLELHVNKICVLWCFDGRVLVKKLLRGSRKDRWNINSLTDGSTEPDIVLDRVARVTGIKYP